MTTKQEGARTIRFGQPLLNNLADAIDDRNKANRRAGRPKESLDQHVREWGEAFLKKEGNKSG